jgi:hypothetical protein
LEARISEKKFLSAVELLGEALKTIRQPDMMEIGALSDLRAYLGSQESVMSQYDNVQRLSNNIAVSGGYFGGGIAQPSVFEVSLLQRAVEGVFKQKRYKIQHVLVPRCS